MTATIRQHHLPETKAATTLEVQREDIRFWSIGTRLVFLSVEVHNRGDRLTATERMEVRVAPFGAFVESEPVAILDVPPVPPGGSVEVGATFEDDDEGRLRRVSGPARRRAGLRAASELESSRPLAQDNDLIAFRLGRGMALSERRLSLLAMKSLLGRVLMETAAFAGNFDVHIRGAKAERHMAQAVRLVPGKENVAFFRVGSQAGEFLFDLQGSASEWGAQLMLADRRLELGEPMSLKDGVWVTLTVTPPHEATEGLLAVGVTQCETGERALVEFGFGLDTIPPRCFRD